MDIDSAAAGRTGPFWDAVAGRIPAPPAAETLGWAIEDIDPDAGTVRVAFDAKPAFRNPMGNIQGGFLAAMLDETMGPAAISALEPGYGVPTLELKVSFIKPGRPGRFVADARVVHMGRSVVFLESSLVDDDGNLIATGTATARIVPLKR